jgi:hypothetical protein
MRIELEGVVGMRTGLLDLRAGNAGDDERRDRAG